MISKKELTPIFAPAIFAYIEEYKKIKNGYMASILIGAITDSIKKWSSSQLPMMISENALSILKENLLKHKNKHNFKLESLIWTNRNIFGKVNDKYNNVVYEHTTPLSIFVQKLIMCKNINEIENMLINYSGVCILTKSEDLQLNKNCYKVLRPNGWRFCYKKVGINTIPINDKLESDINSLILDSQCIEV